MSDEEKARQPVRKRKQQRRRHSVGIDTDGSGSESSGSEQKQRPADGEEVKKSFRLSTRRVFLTYSSCPIPGEELFELLQTKLNGIIKDCFAKQEKHADGSLHCHIFLRFTKKLESTNQHVFDVGQQPAGDGEQVPFHPNIKRCSKGIAGLVGAYEYLCKDGITPEVLHGNIDLYPRSKGFVNQYRDRNDWLNYRRANSQRRPHYPISGPNGEQIPNPKSDPIVKKRHCWVHGPPDAGKSTWLRNNVLVYQCYRVGNNECPFDNYQDQQIIVYDDITPKADHLLSICEFEDNSRPVPGRTRYMQRYVPGGLAILVIVCSNYNIRDAYPDETDVRIMSLRARFNEYEFLRIHID